MNGIREESGGKQEGKETNKARPRHGEVKVKENGKGENMKAGRGNEDERETKQRKEKQN